MLVVLGGFSGSGKGALANKLAQLCGLYHYDSQARKMHRYYKRNDGALEEVHVHAYTEPLRITLYERMLTEFPRLSKMYTDVIVTETFESKASRDHFLKEAAKYFDRVLFVWIDADEKDARRRLQELVKQRDIGSVEVTLRDQRRREHIYQPPGPGVPVFTCVRTDKQEAQALWRFINESLRPDRQDHSSDHASIARRDH